MRPRDLARGEGREPCAWWITTNRGAAWAYVDAASRGYVQVEARGSARYWLPVMSTHYAYDGTAREAVASLVEDLQRAGVVVLDVEAPVPLDDGSESFVGCVGLDVASLVALLRMRRGGAARGGWRE